MKVYRTSEVLAGGKYEVGDIVSYTMEDGEKVEALAVKEEFDKHGNLCMVFMLLDCLKEECRMNRDDTNDGGYEESHLRDQLTTKYLEKFPAALRLNMVPFENGDLLRIPTEREIFGRNIYGEEEPNTVEQFKPMKKRRNRMAFDGLNGETQAYWLQNKRVRSATSFCYVNSNGNAGSANASYSYGVRPLYRIRNYR
ncbi:DUF6273 domain-containing protein [Mediterraneibacter gnavus]|uniref:DUF6273 domain-containing protein n=1 Tax=Mediterraneibacter gnavus TaxID=33038 RepID=UPI00366E2758